MRHRKLLILVAAAAVGAAKQDFNFEISVLKPSQRPFPDELKQKDAENYNSISNRDGRTTVPRGEV